MAHRSKLYALCYQEGHPEKIVAVHDLSGYSNMEMLLFYQTQMRLRRVIVQKRMTDTEFTELHQEIQYPT